MYKIYEVKFLDCSKEFLFEHIVNSQITPGNFTIEIKYSYESINEAIQVIKKLWNMFPERQFCIMDYSIKQIIGLNMKEIE